MKDKLSQKIITEFVALRPRTRDYYKNKKRKGPKMSHQTKKSNLEIIKNV